MKKVYLIMLALTAMAFAGCHKQTDSRVTLDRDVRSDTIESNIITKPIGGLVNILIGQGIEITEVTEARNTHGFLEVQVRGVNKSVNKKVFEHRTDWLDDNGIVLDTQTSNWMPVSAMPGVEFTFMVVSPRKQAVDFRINTRPRK